MKIFDYEIDINSSIDFINKNIYSIIGLSILLFIFVFIIFIFVSFVIIKLLKSEIDNNNIFFYDFNKHEKYILEKYGNYKIEQIYIVKQPLNAFIDFIINILTFNRYKQIINESKEYLPHHTQFILSIRLPNKMKKLILLEKNNCVSLSENFTVHNDKKIKVINVKKKGYTLNKLLDDTLKRIGKHAFFNWHIYKNNCQRFSKEILLTIGKLTKENKDFLYEDRIFQRYYPSEFMLHILNCLCVILNIFEKYIYNYFF
jgi:hypothetical protein